MTWVEEFAGWLSERFVYDDVGRELDRLSNLLRHPDVEERLTAVKQLSFMNASDSVALLIGALGDADSRVRGAAATGLGHKASRDSIAPIAILLEDADAGVRHEAVQALDAIGYPAAHSWLRFWRERVAPTAADPRIAEILGRALSDADATVRRDALAALPRHGARGVSIIRDHFSAQGTDRAQLDAVRQPLTNALTARNPDHRKAAVETLFALHGTDAIQAISEALNDSNPEVRKAAVEAVSSLGPRAALEDLLPRLGDSDEGVVIGVIEGLVCSRNLESFSDEEEARIHQELLRVVRYGSGRRQEVAVWATGELRRVEAVSTLCDLLGGDRSESLLAAVCDALGKINDPRSIAPLLQLVEEGATANATIAALRALTRANDIRVIPPFVQQAFREARPEVDRAYDEAFGALCRPAEERVQSELQHADRSVRLAAIRRAVNDPRLIFVLVAQILENDEELRSAALDVLEKQGFDLLSLARSALGLADKEEARRILAINLMSSLRPPDAAQLFDNLLVDANEPLEVYRHSVAALTRIGSEPALEILKRHTNHLNDAVRQSVQQALAPPAATP